MALQRRDAKNLLPTDRETSINNVYAQHKALLDESYSVDAFFKAVGRKNGTMPGVLLSNLTYGEVDAPADDNDFLALKAAFPEGFSPPQDVRSAAKRGLKLREQFKRGGTMVGVARARDLSNGASVSASTIMRMVSYFARHEVDKKGRGWAPGSEGYPSPGRIAWLLWGGDPGRRWANAMARRIRSNAS